ncbi:MAG: hypothetical protein O7A06_05540 [Acidobacteria bacterium]|nr:hypothetical protein [Acidobacteriota bacterium]MCZ6751814.1 hypothetical protein [Acidobacteriota bacterium]
MSFSVYTGPAGRFHRKRERMVGQFEIGRAGWRIKGRESKGGKALS